MLMCGSKTVIFAGENVKGMASYYRTIKIRNIPRTIAAAPKTLLEVSFSWKIAKPAIAEKRGVVDEIGTACDSRMFTKLIFIRNQPSPFATSPPTQRAITELRLILSKPRSLFKTGKRASMRTAIALTLRVMRAKSASEPFTPGRVTATSINVMLTDHTTAVARLRIIPLRHNLLSVLPLLVFSFPRLRSRIPRSIDRAPRKAGKRHRLTQQNSSPQKTEQGISGCQRNSSGYPHGP